MGYRHLSLLCTCGQTPSRIDEVGLTGDHELVIHWWCEECRRVVYATKPLIECWEDCPSADSGGPPPRPPISKAQCGFDGDFLKSLGIRMMDEV